MTIASTNQNLSVERAESPDTGIDDAVVNKILYDSLDKQNIKDQRAIVIIPDSTRSGPVSRFFKITHDVFTQRGCQVDYLVALGTHPVMSEEAILKRIGITLREKSEQYADVALLNHRWDLPKTFTTIGTISAEEMSELSRGYLNQPVPVRLNKTIFEYDLVLICGPVFPHEVVGFSGGNKYFFPGIAGQEVIDLTHWLGALMTSNRIIGTKDTPVRDVINKAASFIDMPKLALCFVAESEMIAGAYVGSPEDSWSAAANLAAKLHVHYVEHKYEQVLSVIPKMYDDIWTGAKGMYKLEPVISDEGEVIIYAPHITEFSYTHGDKIEKVGYHVRDYFVKQWDKFKHLSWGVLAHSTHLRGDGSYDETTEEEKSRIRVTLATGISKDRCEKVHLGYRDPDTIDPEKWRNREDERILLVPNAGEQLYRLSN